MSWLFSRALVAEYWAANCSDGERFAPLSATHTPQAYLSPDKMTAFSRPSRFGMTFAPLTEDLGAELLTWFLAGFPAKTSALPEKAQALTESEADYGLKWSASLARFDRHSRSWKTVQPSLLVDSDECSVTWPRSGMTVGGRCWALPMLVRRTGATGSGLWPTPAVNGNYNRKGASPTSGDGLATAVKKASQTNGKLNPTWVERLMGWPKDWTSLEPMPVSEWAGTEPWGPDWEDGIMRVADGVVARVDRLRALGNGQVPLCAARAWQLLTGDFTARRHGQ
jgi:hypothetical protein